jgi:DNA-binding response OmpR family regulator
VKILYAEDDILMQKIVVRAFVRLGYEVTTVDDGQEAIDAIISEDYNLIILDLFMPKKSGFEVVEFIREELKSSVPVLIISRNHLEETIQQAYTTGASDYIVKPFSAEDLVVKVTKLLSTYR